jgi:hypothetical protein
MLKTNKFILDPLLQHQDLQLQERTISEKFKHTLRRVSRFCLFEQQVKIEIFF